MNVKLLNRKQLVTGVVIAGLAVGAFFVIDRDNAGSAQTTAAPTLNTASVVRTDLVEEVSFSGTVGLLDSDPVTAPADGIVTGIASAGETLTSGDSTIQISGVDLPVVVADGVLYRDLGLGDAPIAVGSTGTGTVDNVAAIGTSVSQGDVLYRFDGEPVVALYGDIALGRTLEVATSESTTSSYASDVQAAQNRADLVDAIADAKAASVEAQASVPSTALFNAIDELTELEYSGAEASAISRANQAVAAAQQADLERIESAEAAIGRAEEALVEFDERQAAADLDAAVAQASRVTANPTGLDILQLETALAALGYDANGTMTVDSEYTAATASAVTAWQTDVGMDPTGVVEPTQVVFIPEAAIVTAVVEERTVVSPGSQIITLSGGSELMGDDVLLLEEALTAGGAELEPDGVFDDATFAAVLAWQEATGQVVDGIVSPSDVLLVPEDVLVSEAFVAIGDTVRSGDELLVLSSTERVVTIDIPAADQSVLAIGDFVGVELPDFTLTEGVVTEMAATATTGQDGSTFAARIELVEPTLVAHLDEAPVDVIAIQSEINDALAVPVTALIALAEGGYAVEIAQGAGTRLVAVDPGFYADGLVEIRSGDLVEGDLVTVP